MRAPRFIAALLLVCVLCPVATGCRSGEDVAPNGGDASIESTPPASPGSADELRSWIDERLGGEDWTSSLERIVYATKLGSRAIELHFVGTPDEARRHADAAFAALHSDELALDAWVEAWAGGVQFAGTGLGTPREREYPPPPEDVTELGMWLGDVFGPSEGADAESWHASIEGIELGESAARRPVIIVRTDLPADDARSAEAAGLIIIAIARARPAFASEVEVWYADERGLLTGSTDTYDPYVY